jgi:hypothetical protein
MYFDRIKVKEGAKQRLRLDGVPSYKKITLVFLLLTSLLPELVNDLLNGPTTDVLDQVLLYYQNMDMEGASQLMGQFYTSNIGMVTLGCSILMALFTAVVNVGYFYYLMNMAYNRQSGGYDDLSYGLNFVGKIILLTVMQTVFVFLWSILFIIPGIIAMYRYRMSFYALVEDPSISPSEALRRSKMLMRGRKGELFVLDLSFLGWSIVGSLCAAVGQWVAYMIFGGDGIFASVMMTVLGTLAYLPLGIWITAYMNLASVYFYDYAKAALTQEQQMKNNPAPGGEPPYGNPQPPMGGGSSYGSYGDDWQNQKDNGEQENKDPWD